MVVGDVIVDDNDDNDDSSSWVYLLKTPLLQGQEEDEWNDGNDAVLRQVNNGHDGDPFIRTTTSTANDNVECEEGVKETEGSSSSSSSSSAAAAARNKMNSCLDKRRRYLWWWWLLVRVTFLHGFLIPYVFANMYWSISDYQSHLILGLEFPILTYTMIGLAVPVELYLVAAGVIILAGVVFSPIIAYHVMLLTCPILTILIGYKKFRSLQRMEYENMKNRKKHDDDCDEDDDHEGVRVEPIPAGELLDELRLQETIRRREKKYVKQCMKNEILAVYTGIAILDDQNHNTIDTIVV